MSNSLSTLIKLASRKVEHHQQQLTGLQQAVQEITARIQHLQQEVARGHQQAARHSDPFLLQQAGLFAQRAAGEIDDLHTRQTLLTDAIEKERALLRAQFAEQKRYEILRQQRETKAQKARDKKAQKQMDDMANARYRNPQKT